MSETQIPLPERIRPRDLSEIIGQDHLLGEQAPLRQMIDQGHLPSVIFWGPPGSGKTTLAHLISTHLKLEIFNFNAVTSGIPELKKVIQEILDLKKYAPINVYGDSSGDLAMLELTSKPHQHVKPFRD